jgi:hypothetical protein
MQNKSLVILSLSVFTAFLGSSSSGAEYVIGTISKASKSNLCPVQVNGAEICAEFNFAAPGLQKSIAEALSKKGSLILSGTWKAPLGDRPQMFEIGSIGQARE